jgi:hypothetical protein
MEKMIELDNWQLETLEEFCDKCQFSKECLKGLGGFQAEEALKCAISYLRQYIRRQPKIVWVERTEM